MSDAAEAHYQDALTLLNSPEATEDDVAQAIGLLSKAIFLAPKVQKYYIHRGKAYFGCCDIKSAISNYRRAYVLNPSPELAESIGALLNCQGQLLMRMGQLAEADHWLEEACEMVRSNPTFWADRASCAMRMEEWLTALHMLEQTMAVAGPSAPLHMLCAVSQKAMGNVAAGLKHAESALALVPDYPGALAYVHETQDTVGKIRMAATDQVLRGKPTDGANVLLAALAVAPNSVELRCKRAALLRLGGHFEDALVELEALLPTVTGQHREMVRRQMALAYNDRGLARFSQGDFTASLGAFNMAIEACPELPLIFANRGDCYREKGEIQFAMSDYQQALALRPDDRHTLLRLALVYDALGTQFFNSGNFERAMEEFTKAVECAPDVAPYRQHRAEAALRVEDFGMAFEDYRAMISIDPENPALTMRNPTTSALPVWRAGRSPEID
ncbi:putative tetratricopeptide repeat protein 16 [Paratrimastix pyriformis]|uniref:Tetratricopeptide repeat protein 16 n=1 Tax=Paratrimastix pyriformis TaxID=342808 RepID=A0ABQ8ULJ5_9EUKA|nr:putative tetratricopeptide repeat protein 16 [Paratrimastix pyriformis]